MKVLYFAWLRNQIGVSEESLDLPNEVETVADVLEFLRAKGSPYVEAFAPEKTIRVALDQNYAALDAPISSVAEIAFFPPVTGG